ncbi:DUF4174 domain-containing protein [Halioxenophilus aromaticivorans]|uniref:DUF4174 domain-containing protein n=1 Tax=Halioxenophilus aromaticivorans TaxID=1306992 RepID=A0AAV3U475_9ALTE
MRLLLAALALIAHQASAGTASVLASLDQLKWQSRIIAINASTNGHSANPGNIESYKSTLKAYKSLIEDRDIVWLVVTSDAITSNFPGSVTGNVRTEIQALTTTDGTSVVLIGKDGTVKDKSNTLDLESLFGLIDTMPMRINEMQSKR